MDDVKRGGPTGFDACRTTAATAAARPMSQTIRREFSSPFPFGGLSYSFSVWNFFLLSFFSKPKKFSCVVLQPRSERFVRPLLRRLAGPLEGSTARRQKPDGLQIQPAMVRGRRV